MAAVEKTLNKDPSESDELECLESTGCTVDCSSIQKQNGTVMKDDRNETMSYLNGGLPCTWCVLHIVMDTC